MDDFEKKIFVRKIYDIVNSIEKPKPGKNFVESIYSQINDLAEKQEFEINEYKKFELFKVYKGETPIACFEIQFGSKKDSYRSINILSQAEALIGVYITSSKSRGLPIPQIINSFSHFDNKPEMFIAYDIETGHHMMTGFDSAHEKMNLYNKINLGFGPKKFIKTYSKKRKKIVYGKKQS
ncbi:hypothetical protein KO465_01160 [Candidatus Micrarchaeota archaeon]|nr:hypothetical protein [Candidatus Micrarchaeota archaeon]